MQSAGLGAGCHDRHVYGAALKYYCQESGLGEMGGWGGLVCSTAAVLYSYRQQEFFSAFGDDCALLYSYSSIAAFGCVCANLTRD